MLAGVISGLTPMPSVVSRQVSGKSSVGTAPAGSGATTLRNIFSHRCTATVWGEDTGERGG